MLLKIYDRYFIVTKVTKKEIVIVKAVPRFQAWFII